MIVISSKHLMTRPTRQRGRLLQFTEAKISPCKEFSLFYFWQAVCVCVCVFNYHFIIYFRKFIFCLFHFIFGRASWHVASQFPNQGWNLCPLSWKHGALTSRDQGRLKVCFIFKLIFIGVQLLYNVVLVSAVHQSESPICIHTCTC